MRKAEYAIREARPEDLALLPAIELSAASLFADRVGELGISREVLEGVKSVEDHRNAQRSGCVLVAVDRNDKPVGFALVIELDGALHLDELDVAPEHGRRGLGAALLEELFRWGKARGFGAVTLSTFRDIPWNRPFYARMGFVEVDPSGYSPGLAALVAGERERGLPIETRVVMRRRLVE
jgi:GNAT superfamily N-acetyltransferase